jgi:hypothetical protein
METTCPAGLAGLPAALCHSQRNWKRAGLEPSAWLVTRDFAQVPKMDWELGVW